MHDEVNPVVDLETVETELLLADIETLSNAILRLEKATRSGDKEVMIQRDKFHNLSAELSSGILGRNTESLKNDQEAFKELGLITVKPCLYVGNVEDLDSDNILLEDLVSYAEERDSTVIPMCNQLEAEIAELDFEEGMEFLKDMGLEEPGLNKLIRESYKMLSLITIHLVLMKLP